MKKRIIYFCLVSAFAGVGFFAISCDKDNEMEQETIKNDVSIYQRSGDEMEKFKSDLRLDEIYVLNTAILELNPETDYPDMVKKIERIKFLVAQINDEYGEEDVEIYLDELGKALAGGSGGNKCKRKPNGLVNADECNFFEMISVGFQSSFSCYFPELPNTALYNQYYDCVQSIVCKTC